MGLETKQAVQDMDSRLFEFACPADIGQFVEASTQFDQRQDLLSGLRCVDQRINDWRITGSAVKRLLDRQY
ncbi:hypothetical protein GALL_505960 [mine drainage metagenome]|uniref:Uncharacterized protein n=1 Tax=mine drainage metagenome TaxID=410659 RepID=A0A1J5PJ93_9ZZZZ